jgi:hypothetical protein
VASDQDEVADRGNASRLVVELAGHGAGIQDPLITESVKRSPAVKRALVGAGLLTEARPVCNTATEGLLAGGSALARQGDVVEGDGPADPGVTDLGKLQDGGNDIGRL